ncbi:MAG: hypothetical protein LBE22_03810 [Azoarcus sp.]|jgi:hypothetical protein|nr:hypothetical protein [Azoarcus sp.]
MFYTLYSSWKNRVQTPRKETRPTIRRSVLIMLSVPFILAFVSLLVASVINLRPVEPGTLEYFLGITCFSYLILCVLVFPSYGGAFLWFWWRSRFDPDNTEHLERHLSWVPLITAVFMWWPFAFIPGMQKDSFQAFLMLAAGAFIGAYLWIRFVRFVVCKKRGL